MKWCLYFFILITSTFECYSHLIIGQGKTGLIVQDILDLNVNEILDQQSNGLIPYTSLQGKRINLSKLPGRYEILTLRIWGKLRNIDKDLSTTSIASIRLWRNPNRLIAPKIYHNHIPKHDSIADIHLWEIPLGNCSFVSSQKFHFSLPRWNFAKYLKVSKIEIVSGELSGTKLSIDQTLLATNFDELFTDKQWENKFQLIDQWFLLIVIGQVIVAFCMIRYYMFAQAYLCLMFFCLLASYWYQWPFLNDVKKALLIEENAKFRKVLQQGFDIPRTVEFELNREIQNLVNNIKDAKFESQPDSKLVKKLNERAKQLGFEISIEYDHSRYTINIPKKIIKSLEDPISIEILGTLRTLLIEHLSLKKVKNLDRERNDRFNKKLKAVEELLQGLLAENQSLLTFFNNPGQLISIRATPNSKTEFMYWNYFWDDNDQFVVILFRLKPQSYFTSVENYVKSYYSKALEAEGWDEYNIYFRSHYGSGDSSKIVQSYKLISLHEQMLNTTEFLYYDYQQNTHELYYGSKFESIPKQRVIFKVNANRFANRLKDETRQLSLYKIGMITVIPLLALLISGLVSWRLRTLRLHLERMNLHGSLMRLKVEGRDQISDLFIQVNRLLIEPIRRHYFVSLKEELSEHHAKSLDLVNRRDNLQDQHELVYVVLENLVQDLPAIITKNIRWICRDNKCRLTGWCSFTDLIAALSKIEMDSNNILDAFSDCKVSILRMDYEVTKHSFRSVTEVPTILPILDMKYIPYPEVSTIEKIVDFKIFTNLEDKHRALLLSCLGSSQQWLETTFEGLNGYYLH